MKNKDHISHRLELPSNKRRLVGPAKQVVPWYSLDRPRNLVIIASILTSLMFLKPIMDAFGAARNGIRLYREQEKFKRELDLEEAELLQQDKPK